MFERLFSRSVRRRPDRRSRGPRHAILWLEPLEERAVPTLTLSPTTLPNPVAGVKYTQTLTASGGTAPYTFTVSSGSLPAGLALTTANGTTTISGTPTAAGPFSFTVQTTDSASPANTGSQKYVGAVVIGITPTTLPNPGVGVKYTQTLTASGGTGSYTFTVSSGSLPAGLTLTTANGTTTISGTPTTGGPFNFTVQVTDSATPANIGSQKYTGSVIEIAIAPTTLTAATVGVNYSQTLTASGGTAPYTFAVSTGSTLPAGLKLSTAGVLSGKPTAAGTFTFSVTAKDSSTGTGPFTGSQNYTLMVNGATITLGPKTLKAAHAAAPYSQALSASGGTAPYKFVLTSGSLPKGVTLTSAGVLTGTPSVAGTFHFTAKATDSSTGTGAPFNATGNYTLTVQTAAAAHVVFLTPLRGTQVNSLLPSFAVEVLDALNRPMAGVVVSLKLVPLGSVGPAGFTAQSVTTSVTLANGVALFPQVAVNTRGLYQIEADVGLVKGLSNAFQVSLDGRHSP
jgi:hypothetical protein